jgi:hypothetical protein
MAALLKYIKDVWAEGRKAQPKWWGAKKEVDLVAGFFTMLNDDERRMNSGIGFGHFIYEAQIPVISAITNMPKVLGRTDIQFAHGSNWGPLATIEFKRLDNKSNLRKEYFVSGVARFVSGKYAPNHDTGFMAGMTTATLAAEKAGLVKFLDTSKLAAGLALKPLTHPAYGDPSIYSPSVEFDTQHQRASGSLCPTVRIGHILLER